MRSRYLVVRTHNMNTNVGAHHVHAEVCLDRIVARNSLHSGERFGDSTRFSFIPSTLLPSPASGPDPNPAPIPTRFRLLSP